MKPSLLFHAIFLVTMAYGQPTRPVVGQPAPEFWFSDVHYYSKKTIGPGDLKGKWVILDFWSQGCTACVKSFPKLNELQQEFKKDVQFLLVGINDKNNKNIKRIYERFREKLNLNLTVAYDSVLPRQFEVSAVPYVVILDPSSNVHSITNSDFLQRDNIYNMINNKPGVAREASQRGKVWEFWANDTLKNNRLLYRSILSHYAGEALTGGAAIDKEVENGTYQTVHLTLRDLYFAAYNWYDLPVHSRWDHPILEINDTSEFQFDSYSYAGFYNYSITVPASKSTRPYIIELMQADLKKYFGYEIFVEKRRMPYYRLVASENGKKRLMSTARELYYDASAIGLTGRKITIENLLSLIRQYNSKQPLSFVDETGITGNIDISFTAVMTNLEDVKRALNQSGLRLELAYKQMFVLVVRDPESPSTGY